MSDLLSERLHQATDRLATRPPSPANVRRAAETRRRRTRAVAAALTAVAVLATGAVGVVLVRGDGRGAPDVPAVSPTPKSAVTLERFLLPSDLPSSGPFTAWDARHDTRDMVGSPTCTTMIKGEPEQSRLVEFAGGAVGTRGYQSVAAYSSIEAATSASLAHAQALKACVARLDATTEVTASSLGGDGFQVLRRGGRPGETQLTVHARVGRLVSVVWLAAPSDAALRGQAYPQNLLNATLRRLAGTPDPAESQTPAEDPLAAAMLESTDVTGGSASYDDITASVPERNGELPVVAHPCGRPNPTDDMLLKTFSSGPAVFVLQRIVVATDVAQARDFEQALMLPRASGCAVSEITLVDRPDGASVSVLRYPAQVELDRPATVHVAIVRVGTVVTEVVLVDRLDDEADQSRFVMPLVETAIERIRAAAIPGKSSDPTLAEIASRFLAYARGQSDDLPVDTPVRLYLGNQYQKTIQPLRDGRQSWEVCAAGYAERSCPMSAVEVLRSSEQMPTITPAASDTCFAAAGNDPTDTGGSTVVVLAPLNPFSCADDYAVQIWSNDVGQITAVNLLLGSP